MKANIDEREVNTVNKRLEDSIKDIYIKKKIAGFEQHRIEKFLLKEDIEKMCSTTFKNYKYYTDKLKDYTTPNLLHESDNSIINLKNILTTTKKYQVVIIYGEAGCGKTSLTR